MDNFKVTTHDQVTFINNEENSFMMKVEKDRKLTADSKGAIIEATLYKEMSTYVPECSYVFEVIDKSGYPIAGKANIELFDAAVKFFFHSVLDTSLYILSIPMFSSCFTQAEFKSNNTNDIQTSNLYELLSGY